MDPSNFLRLSNGVLLPPLGFGTYQLADPAVCRAAVQRALKCGVQLIDTASVYRNETAVGEAIRASEVTPHPDLNPSNGRVFVTTKASPSEMGLQATYDACLASLERLGQKQVDLYLIHWPEAAGGRRSKKENRKIRLESWRAMERLLEEGKSRSIGVSNFTVDHLNELVEDGCKVLPMVNQVELHPLCPNTELRQWGAEHGMTIQAYSSLGSVGAPLLSHPTVTKVAEEAQRTAAQVLLRWALQHRLPVIPRSSVPDRVEENAKVWDFELTSAQMAEFDAMVTKEEETRWSWDPRPIQ